MEDGGGGTNRNRWRGEVAGEGGGARGGGEGLQRYGPRGRNGLQVPLLVRGRPRTGAETSRKAIGWNRPPREDRATIWARSQRRRGEDLPCDAVAKHRGKVAHRIQFQEVLLKFCMKIF